MLASQLKPFADENCIFKAVPIMYNGRHALLIFSPQEVAHEPPHRKMRVYIYLGGET